MAEQFKILGQVAPAQTTETTLYTVPSSKSAIISTVSVCNQASTPATYRLAIRPAGDSTTAQKHYLVYGATVDGSDSAFFTLGLTLATGDKVLIYTSSATMSATATGSEIS